MPLPRWAIITISLVFVFKVFVASQIALNIDEAYYWVWSLHPAYGYTDEPPMVAWLIWSSSFLGNSPLAIRLPFIACDMVAALAAGFATVELSHDRTAGGVAVMIVTFIPGPHWLLGQANPDAPFVCFWALALWLLLRVEREQRWIELVALGFALGGAVLSRIFGWGLVAGIAMYALAPSRRGLWSRGLWLSFLVVVACYAPFVVWDAAHGWENARFTISLRPGLHVLNIGSFALHGTAHFPVLAAVFILFTLLVTARTNRALLAWTALPLATVLLILSPVFNSQSVWLLGPFTSVAIAAAIAYAESRSAVRVFWTAAGTAAALTAVATILAAALPQATQIALLRALPQTAQHWIYIKNFGYQPLAVEVNSMRVRARAAVLADEYGVASELLYYGVDTPRLVGSDPRAPQWSRWYGPIGAAKRAIAVTHHPLADDKELAQRLAANCEDVRAGPVLHFSFAGAADDTFYTTMCEAPRADASWD